MFEALGDIKNQWSQIKNRIEQSIRNHPELTPEDRHYLRFVMKQSRCFESILLGQEMILSKEWVSSFEEARSGVDEKRLNQYLRRQVRRNMKKLHTDSADGFSVSGQAYRYGDHGIYLATKEKRKRIFILLTDNNQYACQLNIRIFPAEGNLIIHVPVETKVKRNED